jgi:dsDNA-specific endonuclease/ATPase MutS2
MNSQENTSIFDIHQAPSSLQKHIADNFRNILEFHQAHQNKQLFKFDFCNTNQISLLFNTEKSIIFKESNVKKHVQKIHEMINSEFALKSSSTYFQYFLQPTSNKHIYQKRKDLFSKLNLAHIDLKETFKQIKPIKKTLSLPFTLYTLDQSSANYFYDQFKVSLLVITRKELEEMAETFDENTLLITEENLFIETITFTKKEFGEILIGMILKNNKGTIDSFLEILNRIPDEITPTLNSLFNKEIHFDFDRKTLAENLSSNIEQDFRELSHLILNLDEEVNSINSQVKEKIANKQVNLQGQELLDLLNSGSLDALQKKVEADTKMIIQEKEHGIIEKLKQHKLQATNIFVDNSYPLRLDLETKEELLKQVEIRRTKDLLDFYSSLNQITFEQIDGLVHLIHSIDLCVGLNNFINKFKLEYPQIKDKTIYMEKGRNMYIPEPSPISYAIGSEKLNLKNENVSILTGANSGGKTTLLEMILQAQILTSMGLPIAASKESQIYLPEEIIYLKKFTGTQGSGAFEQTIRALVDILDSDTTKLMLIDEFEAVTEPGAAAKILLMFLSKIKDKDALTIAVSHLGKELKLILEERNIGGIRIDGISASGLDEQGNLITHHQPQFYELGKSTPELILQRILQDDTFWKTKQDKTKGIFEGLLD